MSERAFLKEVAGRRRLRIVRGGLDANNLALPPEDVIFDTEAADHLPVLISGSYQVNGPLTDAPFVTWANLGWVPFHIWTLSYGGAVNNTLPVSGSQALNVVALSWGLSVSASGIPFPVIINYVVFRRPL